ncbi:hypothetical protein, partial [Kosakonia cowanii]|uniref:hypothetical protein n=1 Tax=Kosakonia cowanii TaxID=208223 RepID=UPI0039B03356
RSIRSMKRRSCSAEIESDKGKLLEESVRKGARLSERAAPLNAERRHDTQTLQSIGPASTCRYPGAMLLFLRIPLLAALT